MKLKQLIFLLLCCVFVKANAQISDYFNLKDVKTYRFDKLALNSAQDADKFIKQYREYNFISGLKISGNMPLKPVMDRMGEFYEFNELNLSTYSGDLADNTFDSCESVEILHITLPENKLSQLSCLKSFKNLNTLFLYIQNRPDSLEALSMLPKLRELHLIGDFLPAQIKTIVNTLSKKGFLNVLGLSVDRITDLPADITKLRMLSDLILYDNLSVSSNGGIDELTEEKVSVFFNIHNDLSAIVNIHYMSAGSELAAFETAHLEKIYQGQLMGAATDPNVQIETDAFNDDKFFRPFAKVFQPGFPPTREFSKPGNFFKDREEVFRIDPTNNAIITTSTGLRLIIAQNSFVNTAGEAVKEPIYIRISEYRTPLELLFAGLSMTAGFQQYYNNKYTFNVQATTAKTEVQLKQNYQMKAIVPVAKDSSTQYFYDYEAGTWQDLNFYNSVFSSTVEAIDFYKIENNGNAPHYLKFDTSSFQSRYTSAAHYFLNDANVDRMMLYGSKGLYTIPDRPWNRDFNKDGKLKGTPVKKGRALVKLQRVTPKKRVKDCQYFSILDKTDKQIFTELKYLKGINFNIKVNADTKKELTDNFVRNIKFEDVRISYKPGQTTCVIRLKYIDGYKEITASITDAEDDKTLKKQLKKFMKAYKKYEKALALRNESFNANNAQRYNEYSSYVDDKVKAAEKNKTTTEIRLNQLGSFSLFETKDITYSTNLIVDYTDERGVPIDVKELFMLDSRYQTVLKIDKKNLAINPSTCTMIIATDYNGDLYFANRSDILAMNLANNSLTFIKLRKVSVVLNSIEAFINYTR